MEMVEMAVKKRVGIILNSSIYDKLKFVASRYGMTVNSLMAYILGQWADSFDSKEKMTDKVVQELAEVVKREMKELNDSSSS